MLNIIFGFLNSPFYWKPCPGKVSVHVGGVDEEVPLLPLGQRPAEEDRVAGVRGGLGRKREGEMREIQLYPGKFF